MEISQNNIGYFPQMPICDKASVVELNSDFSLPDYQPEIRRLLSSRAIVLPQHEYISNGNAEISGEINYKITYLGADGGLYSTLLSDTYSCSSSLNFNSHSVNNDDITLLPSIKTESVNTRVLGPRKLNVRAKLNCKIAAFAPSLYAPNLVGAHSKATIENRIFEKSTINTKRSENKTFVLNDTISFDSSNDSIRIIDCSSNVAVNECVPSIDKIQVRGDVVVKILYCNDTESTHPQITTRKIPFSCELSCVGVNSLFECFVNGVCYDEKFDFEDNAIGLKLTLSLSAHAQRNEAVKYVADAYSTEKLCECSTSEITVLNAVRAAHGNLTQNDVFSLENIKLSQDSKIIDIVGNCNIFELETEGGKCIFKGNNEYQLIYFLDGEYASLSLNSPVKYELENRAKIDFEKPIKWFANGEISSVKARHDGEKLYVDSELNFNVNLVCEDKIDLLDEMIFSEFLNKSNSEIVLCYPDKNATIWSVAKEYGTPQKAIKLKNSIPENEEIVKHRFLVI